MNSITSKYNVCEIRYRHQSGESRPWSVRPWCRPVESKFCELHVTHGAETKDSISSFYVYPFEIVLAEGFTPNTCAAAVLIVLKICTVDRILQNQWNV